MSRASLTMTPAKPRRSRSTARMRGLKVAGELRVERGDEEVGRHHRGDPRLDRGREGYELALGQVVEVDVERRQREVAVDGGVAVAREVLGAGGHPGLLQAQEPGRHVCRRHERASVPKVRVPMTGLSGLELTSATGARSRSMPSATPARAPTGAADRHG